MRAPQRVFAPGAGAAPPALTGREREQRVLTQCLVDLLGGNAPPHDVALMGPRGNGKTVLLNWFMRACHDAGRIDVVRLSPSLTRSREAVADALLPVSVIRKVLPRKLGVAGVGQAEWAAPDASAQELVERLIARCRKKPVVVLVDEAHTLTRDVGQLLLNLSQDVRANAPFLLVLAGTPGLPAHLATMNASFWSRLGDGRLGIGLLSDAAARAALVEPLATHDVSIDADALDAVVEHSQRYPYFIQLWGEALWSAALGGRRNPVDRLPRACGAARRDSAGHRLLPGPLPGTGSARSAARSRCGGGTVRSRRRGRNRSRPRRRPRRNGRRHGEPAGGARGIESARLPLEPAGTTAAGRLGRRHPVADDLRRRPRPAAPATRRRRQPRQIRSMSL